MIVGGGNGNERTATKGGKTEFVNEERKGGRGGIKEGLVDSPFANFGNCEFEFNLSTFVENCLIVNLFIS